MCLLLSQIIKDLNLIFQIIIIYFLSLKSTDLPVSQNVFRIFRSQKLKNCAVMNLSTNQTFAQKPSFQMAMKRYLIESLFCFGKFSCFNWAILSFNLYFLNNWVFLTSPKLNTSVGNIYILGHKITKRKHLRRV